MDAVKKFVVAVAAVTGVCLLVVVVSRLVFWLAYGSQFSVLGATVVFAYALVATIVGLRFSSIRWSQLGAMGLVFLGLAFASGPMRLSAISEIEGKDISFIILGSIMVIAGLVVRYRWRGDNRRKHAYRDRAV